MATPIIGSTIITEGTTRIIAGTMIGTITGMIIIGMIITSVIGTITGDIGPTGTANIFLSTPTSR
jgi:hypothetical protein